MIRREGHSPLCPASFPNTPVEECQCSGGKPADPDAVAGAYVSPPDSLGESLTGEELIAARRRLKDDGSGLRKDSNAGAFSSDLKKPAIASLGRIVHYRLTANDVRVKILPLSMAGNVCCMLVTAVHDDGSVNGQVFLDAERPPLWVEKVPMCSAADPLEGCWFWPPRV